MTATAIAEGAYTRQIAPETVRIERLLAAPPEKVWDWIVDPDKRRRWFAGGTMEPHAGGKIKLVFNNSRLTANDDPAPPKYRRESEEMTSEATVVEIDPPHRLVIDWFGGSRVTFELEPDGERTRLTLIHDRVVDPGARLSVSTGWHVHLDVLAARIAGEEPAGFWRSITALEPEYAKRIS